MSISLLVIVSMHTHKTDLPTRIFGGDGAVDLDFPDTESARVEQQRLLAQYRMTSMECEGLALLAAETRCCVGKHNHKSTGHKSDRTTVDFVVAEQLYQRGYACWRDNYWEVEITEAGRAAQRGGAS